MDRQSGGETHYDAFVSSAPVHSRENTARPTPQAPRPVPSSQQIDAAGRNAASQQPRFSLPHLPSARDSASSLLDAVVGVPKIPTSSTAAPLATRPSPSSPAKHAAEPSASTPSARSERLPSDSGSSHETGFTMEKVSASESSWDVLSDASSRINEEEAVKELEGRVQKRRSNLPYLESQLAALEARIKEAEERLARAQGQADPTQQTA